MLAVLTVFIAQIYYASNVFYILSLGLSRIAMVVFIRQLTPVEQHRRALSVLAAIIAAWTVAACVAVALQCDLGEPWLLHRRCARGWVCDKLTRHGILSRHKDFEVTHADPRKVLRWMAIESAGAVLEVIIFGMVIWVLVWSLQTTLQRKAGIVTMFALRLP